MSFVPIQKMMERVKTNGEDSDSVLFHELLYAGEFITKITVAAFVALIEDDRDNNRYRCEHTLVRADGIGEWAKIISEICIGTTSQHLFGEDHHVFSERVGKGNWQYEVVKALQEVLTGVNRDTPPMPQKVRLLAWFTKFVELRNKTRGHGALRPATSAKLVPKLQRAIESLIDNNPLFKRPWAYLHRNLSGKYRVVLLGGEESGFSKLKTAAALQGDHYSDGIYLWVEKPRLVSLLRSDLDTTDFFVPNGAFKGETYELHSPITDDRRKEDVNPYLAPPSDRPPSETEGLGELDTIGNVFTNLPEAPVGYVRRPTLEKEVRDKFTNDRHEIVTLVGRGGIGKTSLALTMLHEIAKTDRYEVIVWFSARDIDLTETGPKIVRPKTLTDKDIIEEYKMLVAGPDNGAINMAKHMHNSPHGPTLFVFDNFETVRHPIDLYQWIDTNIRLPNKAIITTRFRDFKADFPIEVSGMEYDEAKELIEKTAKKLNIQEIVGTEQVEQVIEGSNGHPYVIKIILGEMADSGKFSKPKVVMARKDDILDALFERTYNSLSPLANRIFLTLSGWRSLVPQLAVEAVLHWRNSDEDVDPKAAVDELVRMSLIERTVAEDKTDFLGVPITAALFGNKKLEVSPYRELIRDDIQFLQDFSPTTLTSMKKGSYPRVRSFFRKVASQISDGNVSMEERRPLLEFIAQNYQQAWLLLADLEKETGDELEDEAEYIRRFLEQSPQGEEAYMAWMRLVYLYRRMGGVGGVVGSCSAFLSAAEIREPDIDEISNTANYVNSNREIINEMDAVQRSALLNPLAKLMEKHRDIATARDLSRLAWLYLHSGDKNLALKTAKEGLQSEPGNDFCQRLVDRLEREL